MLGFHRRRLPGQGQSTFTHRSKTKIVAATTVLHHENSYKPASTSSQAFHLSERFVKQVSIQENRIEQPTPFKQLVKSPIRLPSDYIALFQIRQRIAALNPANQVQ